MAQETWAAKMDVELKTKLQEIIKSNFDSSQDFIERVLELYQLDQLKVGSQVFKDEIEELEALTRRINGIFINANEKINTMLIDKEREEASKLVLKEQLIGSLQEKIEELKQEKEQMSSMNEGLYHTNQEYKKEMEQMLKSREVLEDLVKEYKEKNDTLSALLTEYKADHGKVSMLQEAIDSKDQTIKQMQLQMDEQSRTIEKAGAELEEKNKVEVALHEEYQNRLQAVENKHQEQLAMVKDKCKLEYELQLIEVQKAYQSQMQTLQSQYTNEIHEYQSKYRALLEQIERSKMSKE